MFITEEFGAWKYLVDREATVAAYAKVDRGGAEGCDCSGCRNFRVARQQVFPVEFFRLLDRLGIDPFKDAEVYQVARNEAGGHIYGGWFHFVGELAETGDFPVVSFGNNFTAWMRRASAPRLESLETPPVVQLEFSAEAVPWLLNEPELR